MDNEFLTFGGLAVMFIGGWLMLVSRRMPAHLEREMASQLRKSADTIRGAPLE
jgi:hypothetical protein